jgi:hypothetical protein
MALGFSTCLRNKMLGAVPARHVATITSTGIAAVDGGSGVDTLTIASGFLAAGFSVGDSIMVAGFSGGSLGLCGPFVLSVVTDTTLTIPTGSLSTGDTAGESVTIVTLIGGSIKDVFKDGVLKIYNGTRPATADAALGGATVLVTISLASATFTSGAIAGGLEFGTAAAAAIGIATGAVWSGKATAAGTAGFFRLYANATDAGGADTTPFLYPRIDGTVATSGGDLNMTSTAIRLDATITVDEFTLTLPATI